MPTFEVRTAARTYPSIVKRGLLKEANQYIPSQAGSIFVVTNEDVWSRHGKMLSEGLAGRKFQILLMPPGEVNKRLSQVEALADQMVAHGADRTSFVVGFGGGIVTDAAGFLAAIFMRGIPVLQIPTTLLAQVDAAVGGKTGVNLVSGKNLIGSFHQPVAVLIDPDVTATLPEREFRAGLFEIVKCGVIRDAATFELMSGRSKDVLSMAPALVEQLIASAVRVKAEVVSADEKESDLRRILNFGHTIGHAIEAQTEYVRFLHGEAVAWGMMAATQIARLRGTLSEDDAARICTTIHAYGPLPDASDLDAHQLIARLTSDKKTVQGKVHFVLPIRIGEVTVVSGIDTALIQRAIELGLASRS